MSRSTELTARQHRNLVAAQQASFITDSIGGTLRDDDFRRYLVIEEAFVLTAVRILGLVVAESESLDDATDHVMSLSNLVGEQREYFAGLREQFPYDGDVRELIESSSILSDYALGLARRDGRAAALVAMFAAETLYLSWCRAALDASVDREPALQEWIEMHTRPAFVAQVDALAREVDAMDGVDDATLDEWFAGMLAAETEFHNAAMR
ncbi:transcriptional regulator [Rhodococcus sp. 06-412-2C]|uniref:TenA family protein n=1 Tax=unclassified Rhodococcus (in: high G+C Gram-positive bacteria) TaxID=192944 RepID=UPI000B9B82BC|nr:MULTISPECIES: TenA family protein [unclassified Rhodococcus (in: high G+C Gram-positive bacteria)]OZC83566.1 transcriptional regulator [Rhodococcus sp. 06-412-2C]OZC93750.1 transcriptional regulator [Rhodococcus sp. 06-412-2B]